jgi:flagellar hook-basal body complex protein FliE
MNMTLPPVMPPGISNAYVSGIPRGVVPSAPTVHPNASHLALNGVQVGAPAKGVMESFAAVLSNALQDTNEAYKAADAKAARVVAGESVDLHQVLIGMESANLGFGLAVQVRNKLLEAYQEVVRMQI